jgi:hypothetical protein
MVRLVSLKALQMCASNGRLKHTAVITYPIYYTHDSHYRFASVYMFTMTTETPVFQDVTLCSLVEVSRISDEPATLLDEGNVHTLLPDYMASHLRRQLSSIYSSFLNI